MTAIDLTILDLSFCAMRLKNYPVTIKAHLQANLHLNNIANSLSFKWPKRLNYNYNYNPKIKQNEFLLVLKMQLVFQTFGPLLRNWVPPSPKVRRIRLEWF